MKSFSKETFIFDLLLAYGSPKASITRLQKGNLNLSDTKGVLSWKRKVLFKEVFYEDLHLAITELTTQVKHAQRFVIVTDYQLLLAIDVKTQDKLDIDLKDLPRHYDFFLPWAGMEKAQHVNENPADVKAAERMAKLFDEIKKDNPDDSPEFVHGLNVFLSRLLFCFFAEDTDIFDNGQFTHAISSHTQKDGSDLSGYLNTLFDVLNTPKGKRRALDGGAVPVYLDGFPYVNGGLFREKIDAPVFTRRSRQAILDSGELNWSAINPDIFGSMIQAVITPEHRGGLGMHYTSVPNIMKVIEPLFLDDLYEAFEEAKGKKKKLSELKNRLTKIKIFDPACGSGNFLIIAYKELRRLEMAIFKESGEIALSGIGLSQFYGIELDDFAHEIAQLSLWLAEHQMNVEFFKEFGRTNPTLPLKEAGNIVQGNACRIDWDEVCPKGKDSEVYILGNPPYLGARVQNREQKEDMKYVFSNMKGFSSLDYIACWFLLASKYISNTNSKSSFVSTNSICQGEQVALLWPNIFKRKVEIFSAHTAFRWSNNAKSKAVVAVIIVGLQAEDKSDKKVIYTGTLAKRVQNISPYLTASGNTIIEKRSTPFVEVPELVYGNQAVDGGFLIMSREEKKLLIAKDSSIEQYFRPLFGASDFMKNIERWCIWVNQSEYEKANESLILREIFERVKTYRITGGEVARSLVNIPYRFRYVHQANENLLIVPRTTSSLRQYLPVGFKDKECIVTDSIQVIYDAPVYIMGLLSSRIHMTWVKSVAGGIKTDIGYSNSLCYNAFPFPTISNQRKEEITQCVFRILEEREKHSEKTLAQLYDPDKMPEGLREAHRQNDLSIERCYRSKPFESDEERLEYLFKLYEKMIVEEEEKNTLFAKNKKIKKLKK